MPMIIDLDLDRASGRSARIDRKAGAQKLLEPRQVRRIGTTGANVEACIGKALRERHARLAIQDRKITSSTAFLRSSAESKSHNRCSGTAAPAVPPRRPRNNALSAMAMTAQYGKCVRKSSICR